MGRRVYGCRTTARKICADCWGDLEPSVPIRRRLCLAPLQCHVHECSVMSHSSCDPLNCSPPDSSVHGIFQARIREWVAVSSSRGIFLTQGSNPHLLCLLHRQADSLPLSHLWEDHYIQGALPIKRTQLLEILKMIFMLAYCICSHKFSFL